MNDQSPITHRPPAPEVLARLAAVVGPEHALADPALQMPYLTEPRGKYRGETPLVLRPGTTAEVAAILAIAHEARVAVVPQSGNTGLVGGQIPMEPGHEVVVSLARLKRVRAIDDSGGSMIAEAGLTLAEARAAAEQAGRLFPLSMASEGSCQIGGNLATNAGGIAVLAYGNARNLVLGLEVVLADGRIWNGLRTLKKDNTGYDLKDLFIGSEGTLGLITAAALKLFPRPAEVTTALAAVARLDDVLALFQLAETTAGEGLTAFEFIPDIGIDYVTRHVPGTRRPFAEAHPWLVLIDISASRACGQTAEQMQALLADVLDRGLLRDAAIAASLQQARDFWRLREELSDAQRHEGGSIKHDISVPIARIAPFVERANVLVADLCPGARPVPFGHFGDGNVHYNVSQPVGMDKTRFLDLWEPMQDRVHALVHEMGGSISAEHGIGRMKRAELVRFKDPVELDLMRAIKGVLDPAGILNPGKVL